MSDTLGVNWCCTRAVTVLVSERWKSCAWALTATYNRLWQEYEDETADRNSNGFLISLVYEPKRTD